MKTQEVLDKIAIAISLLEWEHDISIAAALDVGKKRVKDWERLKEYIKGAKWSAQHLKDVNYRAGYMSALSFIEGQISEMENEDE
jgi:hypothetical protein